MQFQIWKCSVFERGWSKKVRPLQRGEKAHPPTTSRCLAPGVRTSDRIVPRIDQSTGRDHSLRTCVLSSHKISLYIYLSKSRLYRLMRCPGESSSAHDDLRRDVSRSRNVRGDAGPPGHGRLDIGNRGLRNAVSAACDAFGEEYKSSQGQLEL